MNKKLVPWIQALFAALLFGASAPIAKLLLDEIEPTMLAGMLYLGSGIGLILVRTLQGSVQNTKENEAGLEREDYKWLFAAILAGGVVAPITLMFSLQNTPAATASLLLNFESVATILIAVIIFKESISRRAVWAILFIIIASILLSTDFSSEWGISISALGVILACVFWGLDNNFTRNISAKDPLVIVTIKGVVAGLFSLSLAFLLGEQMPPLQMTIFAMLLGSLSYGMSIVLFIHAMRGLGAGRTSALFATAPITGIVLSVVVRK